jgi:predicted nucleic acid-binding protein
MIKRPMLDTDIIIDFLRGRPVAVLFLRGLAIRPMISAVTVGELYSGVREGTERQALDGLALAFRVVPVTHEIAMKADYFAANIGPSHGIQLADALIAATADHVDAELFSLNLKDCPMLHNVSAPYIKP